MTDVTVITFPLRMTLHFECNARPWNARLLLCIIYYVILRVAEYFEKNIRYLRYGILKLYAINARYGFICTESALEMNAQYDSLSVTGNMKAFTFGVFKYLIRLV